MNRYDYYVKKLCDEDKHKWVTLYRRSRESKLLQLELDRWIK